MDTQVKIKFYTFTAKKKKNGEIPIYVRITYNYNTTQLSTGLSTPLSHWNKKTMRFRGDSEESRVSNETLISIELRIRNAINHLLKSGINVSVEKIKNEVIKESETQRKVFECMNKYLDHVVTLLNIDYSPKSLERYRYTHKRILEFIRIKYKKSDFLIEELSNNFLYDFELYLKTSVGNSPKTIQKHIQRFSTMLRFCVDRGIIDRFPFSNFQIKVPIKPIEYLTQDEINRIEQKELSIPRLAIIRDLFVFCIYSGLSFNELKNLHQSNLKEINGRFWIDMIRQKTKRQYNVPLLPKCIEIIERYQYHTKRISEGLLLPVPSNQKFNAYLKEIQDICQIETRLTCHLGRKTFGSTILLQNNVNIHVISQLLGHSSTAITIKSYLGSDPQLMLDEFDKIKEIYPN